MAVYQFRFELIPRKWAEENNFNPEAFYINEDCCDSSQAWVNYSYTLEIGNKIAKFLPEGKSWSEDILAWGNSEDSDIKIILDKNKKIESIIVRIDLTEKPEKYIDPILELARSLNYVIFIPDQKKIIDSNLTPLLKCISNSYADRFVRNPIQYLNELAEKNKNK